MRIEMAARLVRAGLLRCTLGLRPTEREAIFCCAHLIAATRCRLAGCSEVDDLTHFILSRCYRLSVHP